MNNVIVGETVTFWSHGEFICSLEFGCPAGPTISAFHALQTTVSTWVDGGVGTWQIAGNDAELFYVNGNTHEEMYLRRLGGAGNAALSIPRPNLMGPTLDATSVYWTEEDLSPSGYAIRRASRSGDGSDVMTVAMTDWGTDRLTYADGYLWWIELQNHWLTRVPVAGGTPERVLDSVTALGVSNDAVYVGRSIWSSGHSTVEIGRVSTDASYTTIASHDANGAAPRYLVADAGDVFWSAGDGSLYFAPLAGGPVGTVAVDDVAGYAFAVLPDRFLVEFNRYGFRTVAR